jgi:endoglucanase
MTTEGGSGSYYCPGTDQITHFTSKGANLYVFPSSFHIVNTHETDDSFRLPFGWQYMVGDNQASTSLDPTFLGKYDTLVQAVLKSGGYAMLDLHNYARWNGGIVGQGGPSNENVSLISRTMADGSLLVFGACLLRSMQVNRG